MNWISALIRKDMEETCENTVRRSPFADRRRVFTRLIL